MKSGRLRRVPERLTWLALGAAVVTSVFACPRVVLDRNLRIDHDHLFYDGPRDAVVVWHPIWTPSDVIARPFGPLATASVHIGTCIALAGLLCLCALSRFIRRRGAVSS